GGLHCRFGGLDVVLPAWWWDHSMTTQAPPTPSESAATAPAEQTTAPLGATAPAEQTTALLGAAAPAAQTTAPLGAADTDPILDSLGLLDHRTQARAVGRRLAPFGHYLAFEQGGE